MIIGEQREEYSMAKRYLLKNEISFKEIKKMFPNVAIPYIPIEQGEHLVFVDGYLFTVSFSDEECLWEHNENRFYEIYCIDESSVLKKYDKEYVFIKIIDIELAIGIVLNQAYEFGLEV